MKKIVTISALFSLLAGIVFSLKVGDKLVFNTLQSFPDSITYIVNLVNTTYPYQTTVMLQIGGKIESVKKDVISFKDSVGEEHSFLTSDIGAPVRYAGTLNNGLSVPISSNSFLPGENPGENIIATLMIDVKTGDIKSLMLQPAKSKF